MSLFQYLLPGYLSVSLNVCVVTESCLSNIGGGLFSIEDMSGDRRFGKKNQSFPIFQGQRKSSWLGLIKTKDVSEQEHLKKSYVGVCTKLLSKEELWIKLKVFILFASDTLKLNARFELPCLSLPPPFCSCNYCLVRMPQQYMIIAKQFAFCMSHNLFPCAIGKYKDF